MQKHKHDDEPKDAETGKARKLSANARPIGGFALVVDGKFKTQFETSDAAMAAGTKLKQKYPVIRIAIFDAVERSYATVELAEIAAKPGSD